MENETKHNMKAMIRRAKKAMRRRAFIDEMRGKKMPSSIVEYVLRKKKLEVANCEAISSFQTPLNFYTCLYHMTTPKIPKAGQSVMPLKTHTVRNPQGKIYTYRGMRFDLWFSEDEIKIIEIVYKRI